MIPSALRYMLVRVATDLLAGALTYYLPVSRNCRSVALRSKLGAKQAWSEATPEWKAPKKRQKTITAATVTRQH